MNFERIIEKEGYRYEDLSDEHKKQIDILNCLKEDFDSFDANMDAYCDICDDDSIISEIEMEIAEKVIEGVKHWLDSTIAEYQVNLAENENRVKCITVLKW